MTERDSDGEKRDRGEKLGEERERRGKQEREEREKTKQLMSNARKWGNMSRKEIRLSVSKTG